MARSINIPQRAQGSCTFHKLSEPQYCWVLGQCNAIVFNWALAFGCWKDRSGNCGPCWTTTTHTKKWPAMGEQRLNWSNFVIIVCRDVFYLFICQCFANLYVILQWSPHLKRGENYTAVIFTPIAQPQHTGNNEVISETKWTSRKLMHPFSFDHIMADKLIRAGLRPLSCQLGTNW